MSPGAVHPLSDATDFSVTVVRTNHAGFIVARLVINWHSACHVPNVIGAFTKVLGITTTMFIIRMLLNSGTFCVLPEEIARGLVIGFPCYHIVTLMRVMRHGTANDICRAAIPTQRCGIDD